MTAEISFPLRQGHPQTILLDLGGALSRTQFRHPVS